MKYLIVASISRDQREVGLVVINTNQNPYAFKNVDIMNRQWQMRADDRRIVQYNSWADCATLKHKTHAEVQRWIDENPRVVKGRLSGAELYQVQDMVRTAPTINNALKKLVGLI